MISSGTDPSGSGPISRRNVLRQGTVLGAAATIAPPVAAAASVHDHARPRVLPAPRPIPGGIQPPGLPLLHVFAAGPPEVTLPFSGLQLQGLDVEPNVITDYTGFVAAAFHVGSAVGSDGKRYNLETDMRAIDGTYVAADGIRRRGRFGFI